MFTCSNCKKNYDTYTYFNSGYYIDSSGAAKTYRVEMYKCVCPYCNHADTDKEVAQNKE